MESGKATLTRDVTIDKQDYGNIVDITHFDTGLLIEITYLSL